MVCFSFFLVQPQASDIDGHHVTRMRVVISKALTQCGPVKFALDLPESKPKLMVVRVLCVSFFCPFLNEFLRVFCYVWRRRMVPSTFLRLETPS